MHSAWQTYDIRRLIFERLKPQDLARLAQTCKTFFDFTIDELWEATTSLAPFLCCLPPDFRHRPLRAEEICRLDFYASKVRKLALISKSNRRLPPPFSPRSNTTTSWRKCRSTSKPEKSWEDVWVEIAKLRPASEFLPNLRNLHISDIIEELLIPLIGISGSSLTRIYIKYIHEVASGSVVRRIMDGVQTPSKLEYLFVRDGADLIPLKLIQQSPLKHLRIDPRIVSKTHEGTKFKILPLAHEILEKHTLENLSLGLTRNWYTPEIKALKSKYLPALKALWLNLAVFEPGTCYKQCHIQSNYSWTCRHQSNDVPFDERPSSDGTNKCGTRSPTLFLEALDNPELDRLNIKFPAEATGRMFLDVVSAANRNCQLKNLTELVLSGCGWFNTCCWECGDGARPSPNITPRDLRDGLSMLIPMPALKKLRLSVAPNFLDVLDLQLYRSIADGLPALQELSLGHGEFATTSYFQGTIFHERVPLHHLAAFCTMLPNLVKVGMGTVDGLALEERPRTEWACFGVKTLRFRYWAGSDGERSGRPEVSLDLLGRGLRAYFPNSDLSQEEIGLWVYVQNSGIGCVS